VAFARDAGTGLLSPTGQTASGGAAGAFSPDGSLLYASDVGDGIVVYERDASSGALTKREHLRRLLEGPFVDGFADITVSADGEYAYAVSGSGFLIVLRRDPATGAVSLRDRRRPPSDHPNSAIAVHPDGMPIVIGGSDSFGPGGKVVVHALEPRACDPAPRAGCTQPLLPLTSRLVLKAPPASAKSKAVWSWTRGAETPIEAFGDVGTTTHHALCIYDASGAPQPVLDAVAPPGGVCSFVGFGAKLCWDSFPVFTIEYYRYRDKARRDGLLSMLLRSGTDLRAKLKVKGNGATLAAAPSPLALPVRVQLQNDTGACWEATYSVADANADGLFRAKSD
jgi:hypothetical protein